MKNDAITPVSRRRLLAFSAGSVAALALSARGQEKAAAAPPKALVLEHADKWTGGAVGAEELLKAAGFVVEKLPLDRSPYMLEADLIFLGSFVSESPEYRKYVGEFGKELYRFVDRGKVLVQMAQADQTEQTPPFLPSTHGAKRVDADFGEAIILSPQHSLMKDVPNEKGVVKWGRADKRTIWESLAEAEGFEVIMAAEKEAEHPALMEGAYGQGRIILSSMDFDKTKIAASGEAYGSKAQHAFAAAFFKNLYQHALNVRNGRTAALAITTRTRPQEFVPGSWTLAVMPDTQVYALRYPGLFTMQAHWIAANAKRMNIKYALQLGDITNNNTIREWENARAAMTELWGKVPVAMVTGNHDYGPSGDATTRETHFNKYFPISDTVARQGTFGGAMIDGDHQNTFHTFSASGVEWIVICLEWAPRHEVVEWANGVMRRNAGRRGILMTHAYMNNNDRRYDINDKAHPQDFNPHLYKTPGTMNDGEELWQKLVRHHDFALTLNGHVLGDGTGYLASKNDKGRTCHQLLQNYQMRTLGGEAYTRLLEFRPDGKTVQVKTYSPLYDRFFLAPDQQFSFELT